MVFDPFEELFADLPHGQLLHGLAFGRVVHFGEQLVEGLLCQLEVLPALGKLSPLAADIRHPPTTMEKGFRLARHGNTPLSKVTYCESIPSTEPGRTSVVLFR